jgi:hypothetical protein
MSGVSDRQIFIDKLRRASHHQEYPACVKEWIEHCRHFDGGFCICGQELVEVITIRNLINGNRLEVGNVCIKQFGKEAIKFRCSYCGECMRKPPNKEQGLCAECKRDRFIRFGKYKDVTLYYLFKKAPEYVAWLKEQKWSVSKGAIAVFSYIERMERNHWSIEEASEVIS